LRLKAEKDKAAQAKAADDARRTEEVKKKKEVHLSYVACIIFRAEQHADSVDLARLK
jgi:hypothetical protein